MDSEGLAIQTIPEAGGKIQSIWDKRRNKELLHQAQGTRYKRSRYGSDYSRGEASGFDDIFPSIEACHYGQRYEIDRVYPKYAGKCEKYYVMDELSEGWCALWNSETGYTIQMSYPVSHAMEEGILDRSKIQL